MMEAEDDLAFDEPPFEVLVGDERSSNVMARQMEQVLLEADQQMSLLGVGDSLLSSSSSQTPLHPPPKPSQLQLYQDSFEEPQQNNNNRRRLDTASTEGDATSTDTDGDEGSLDDDNFQQLDDEEEDPSSRSDLSDMPELLLPDRDFFVQQASDKTNSNNNAFLGGCAAWMPQLQLFIAPLEEAGNAKEQPANGDVPVWKRWIAPRANGEGNTNTEAAEKNKEEEKDDSAEGTPSWIPQLLQTQRSSDSGDVKFLRLFVDDDECKNEDTNDDDDDEEEEVDFTSQDTVVYRPSCFLDDGYKAWDGAGEFIKD